MTRFEEPDETEFSPVISMDKKHKITLEDFEHYTNHCGVTEYLLMTMTTSRPNTVSEKQLLIR